jgi:hypothetical protein
MSATYNWAYKNGITNKYGILIASTANDATRPSNACYVALFGNDATGNGSRQLPYRTIAKAKTIGATYLILGSGTYREAGLSAVLSNFIGDGDVIIDSSFTQSPVVGANVSVYNIKFMGSGLTTIATSATDIPFIDCVFDGCAPFQWNGNTMTNCIVMNYYANWGQISGRVATNCTFYKCGDFRIHNSGLANPNCGLNNIFYMCNIWCDTVNLCQSYSIFYNCNFKFGSGTGTADESGFFPRGGQVYPAVPTGYTYRPTIADIQAAFTAAFPPAVNPFYKCIADDPLFNNVAIADFTLALNSPAKQLSYYGTYVGARSIAFALKARATESAGDFDFSSNTNLTVADNSITFTNPALDGQIDTKVISNLIKRELAKIPTYGFNADRNGQYIDSMADLAGSTIAAGGTLGVPVPYLVETAAITYNGAVYTPGQRFTTVTGVTTFTTAAAGVVREIAEAPQRHTLMARFGDGGGPIAAGAALVAGNWYSVLAGSVTQAGVTYNAPAIFKALTTQAFTGSGTVEIAMSSEAYQHYEPHLKPTSNNMGDARTGAIVRGNGDPAYVRGGLGVQEFPINAKYMQFRYYLKANNLKP